MHEAASKAAKVMDCRVVMALNQNLILAALADWNGDRELPGGPIHHGHRIPPWNAVKRGESGEPIYRAVAWQDRRTAES
jgi:hypothetical protein